jgi:cell division protein FtsL
MVAAARPRSVPSRPRSAAPSGRAGATKNAAGGRAGATKGAAGRGSAVAAALAVIEPPVKARPARPDRAGNNAAAAQRPQLRVVPPKVRRRRAGVLAAFGCAVTFSVMLALTFFQAKIAAEQMRLDAVNRDIREQQSLHSQLNLAIAQLQSPEMIIATAKHNGLVVPSKIAGYIAPTAEQVAEVLTTGGAVTSSNEAILGSASQPAASPPSVAQPEAAQPAESQPAAPQAAADAPTNGPAQVAG